MQLDGWGLHRGVDGQWNHTQNTTATQTNRHILNTLQSPIKILLCVASILQNRGRTLFAPWKRTEHTWSWDISPGKEEGERKIGWILRNVVQHYSHATLLSMRTLHTFKPANHNFRERKIKEVPNSVLQNPLTRGFARLLSLIPTTWWCNWYVSPVCPAWEYESIGMRSSTVRFNTTWYWHGRLSVGLLETYSSDHHIFLLV